MTALPPMPSPHDYEYIVNGDPCLPLVGYDQKMRGDFYHDRSIALEARLRLACECLRNYVLLAEGGHHTAAQDCLAAIGDWEQQK